MALFNPQPQPENSLQATVAFSEGTLSVKTKNHNHTLFHLSLSDEEVEKLQAELATHLENPWFPPGVWTLHKGVEPPAIVPVNTRVRVMTVRSQRDKEVRADSRTLHQWDWRTQDNNRIVAYQVVP